MRDAFCRKLSEYMAEEGHLTFYSSRELTERIQMEINRFISARGNAGL